MAASSTCSARQSSASLGSCDGTRVGWIRWRPWRHLEVGSRELATAEARHPRRSSALDFSADDSRSAPTEVPHHEVLRHVSSVLKDHGFSPAGKGIDIGDLKCCPYNCEVLGDGDLYKKNGDMDATETDVESPDPNAQTKKAVGKEAPKGLEYMLFIPYWRSVLKSRLVVKVWPSFALKEKLMPGARLFHTAASNTLNRSKDEGSLFLNHNIGLLGRISPLQSNYQSRRTYGAAALTLLKMLKRTPRVERCCLSFTQHFPQQDLA